MKGETYTDHNHPKKNGEPTPTCVRVTTKISRLLVKRTLRMRMDQTKTMEEWRERKEWGEWNVAPLPQRCEEESLLVEWARGQGLTVLP